MDNVSDKLTYDQGCSFYGIRCTKLGMCTAAFSGFKCAKFTALEILKRILQLRHPLKWPTPRSMP